MPGAHQAAVSLPFLAGQRRESKIENDLYVEFMKAEVSLPEQKQREKKNKVYSLLPISECC